MTKRKSNLKEKNILYLTQSYKDWIKDPIELMASEFNHVYVIVRHKPIADILDFLNIPFFRMHRSQYKFDLKNLPSNVTVLKANLWYINIIDFIYSRIGDYHTFVVNRLIKKHNIKFDIIHSHIIWSSGYVGAKLSKKYKVPFVVTAHGRDAYQIPFKSKRWFNLTKYVLDSADQILTVSQFMNDTLTKITKNSNILVIPNGFKGEKHRVYDRNSVRDEFGVQRERIVALTVGHIEDIKGHIYIVEGARELVKKFPKLLFVFVGNGPSVTHLKSKIEEYGLEKHFLFTGLIPNEDVAKWYSASDIGLLASKGEGNPTVMFECIAVGTPFVASRVGGIPEIITSDTGMIFEPQNIHDLIKKVSLAIVKNWEREKIIQYAKQFEWRNIVVKILDIYSHAFENTQKD